MNRYLDAFLSVMLLAIALDYLGLVLAKRYSFRRGNSGEPAAPANPDAGARAATQGK